MSQAIQSIITLSLSIPITLWALMATLRGYEQNMTLIRTLWLSEYQAHACGRVLAATANIQATGRYLVKRDPESRPIIISSESYIRRQIAGHISPGIYIAGSQCFRVDDDTAIAEIYLRNADVPKYDEPNFAYRVLPMN